MAYKIYTGINNIAKNVTAMYYGDANGKARKVIKVYQGDANGQAKLVYEAPTENEA